MNLRASILACSVVASPLLVAAAVVTAPSVAQAAPDWVGDFETGDLSQWTLSAQVIGNADNMGVTEEVVAEGQYAARIQVDPGDMSPSGHSRNEVVYVPDAGSFEDSERWYSFSLRPGDDAYADTWHLVYYWEGNPVFASVMSMVVVGQQVRFQTFLPSENTLWTGAFTPSVWQDFILHVRWSPDPATGFVELFVDGEQVVPMTNVATMHGPGVFNEMHTGLLRNDMVDFSEVIYIDGVRAGATMEDVMGTDEPNPGTSTGGGADSTGGDETDDASDSDPTSDPDGTGPGNDDDPDSGPATTASGGSGTASGSSTADADDSDDGGCSCTTAGDDGVPSGLPWLLGVVAVALGRRRRR